MAYKLLPPTPGFFFGGEEIDEWYLEDLEHTYKEIDKLLEKPKVIGVWSLFIRPHGNGLVTIR